MNALQWTKENIQYFGGDPNSITIAGQSAGSVAVTHLMTSPLTRDKDLFHKAIAASGSALHEWGTTVDPMEGSIRVSELVGCYNSSETELPDFDDMIACMKNASTADLIDALYDYQVI